MLKPSHIYFFLLYEINDSIRYPYEFSKNNPSFINPRVAKNGLLPELYVNVQMYIIFSLMKRVGNKTTLMRSFQVSKEVLNFLHQVIKVDSTKVSGLLENISSTHKYIPSS